jgi:peptidoglycan/xylan/chitin deacetylase (PgdA/CDA1 family)
MSGETTGDRAFAGRRLVVFTGRLDHDAGAIVATIDRELPGLEWLVLLRRPRRSLRRTARNQLRLLRRDGWRHAADMLGLVRERLQSRRVGPAPAGAPGGDDTEEAVRARPHVRVLEVADLHAPEAIAAVRAFGPDLGLSIAAPILKRALFGLPRLGTINVHKGKVPEFRGMPPGFWELYHGASEVGCTIHLVDDKLDTGPVLEQEVFPIEPYATPAALLVRLDEVGRRLMARATRDLLAGTAHPVPQPRGGTTYRRPTAAQRDELERRLAARLPHQFSPANRLAKAVVQRGLSEAGRLGVRRALPPRVTVLLYHRVSDAARDNLTIGVEQFDRQMQILRRHAQVVPLEEVLTYREVPRSGRPLVCVTFDDGYLDNYLYAAPILERHQVPATFFVSTGIVNTDRPFPHDVVRGNPPIPNMTWDHLRAMRDAGFAIGSHTVNHIDCAAVPEADYRRELEQSRDDLRRELGLERIIFSYPYGGHQHMTPTRLEMVKRAGYVGCVSAYGGSNIGAVDPFNVLRQGVHWETSDANLRLLCLGWRRPAPPGAAAAACAADPAAAPTPAEPASR